MNLWMPNKRICAGLCRQSTVDLVELQPKQQPAQVQGDGHDEKANDRDQYRSFEEAAVRFDEAHHTNTREVLEVHACLALGPRAQY